MLSRLLLFDIYLVYGFQHGLVLCMIALRTVCCGCLYHGRVGLIYIQRSKVYMCMLLCCRCPMRRFGLAGSFLTRVCVKILTPDTFVNYMCLFLYVKKQSSNMWTRELPIRFTQTNTLERRSEYGDLSLHQTRLSNICCVCFRDWPCAQDCELVDNLAWNSEHISTSRVDVVGSVWLEHSYWREKKKHTRISTENMIYARHASTHAFRSTPHDTGLFLIYHMPLPDRYKMYVRQWWNYEKLYAGHVLLNLEVHMFVQCWRGVVVFNNIVFRRMSVRQNPGLIYKLFIFTFFTCLKSIKLNEIYSIYINKT